MNPEQHPAYDRVARAIVCPICRAEGGISEYTEAAGFERHFLAHNPGAELAHEFLTPASYAVLARARRWTRDIDKVLDQIRKLLALSKSPNEHEAALSAARAAELMMRYQIDEARIGVDAGEPPERIDQHVLVEMSKIVYWKAAIAGALSKAFGGEMIFETSRLVKQAKRKKVVGRTTKFLVIGSSSMFSAVQYMYRYLCREVDRLADAAYARRMEGMVRIDSPRSYKDSYRKAASMTIAIRLQDERKLRRDEAMRAAVEDESLGRALARLDDSVRAVRDYVDGMGVVTPYERQPGFADVAGASDGARDGKGVDLGLDKDRLGKGSGQLNAGPARLPGRRG